jgi:hypothetical protein
MREATVHDPDGNEIISASRRAACGGRSANTYSARSKELVMSAPPIKLPEPYDSQLTALARRRRSTRAKVLGEALAAFDKRDGVPKGQTASALAADLMFEGPGDLSTNPRYMACYGHDARHR